MLSEVKTAFHWVEMTKQFEPGFYYTNRFLPHPSREGGAQSPRSLESSPTAERTCRCKANSPIVSLIPAVSIPPGIQLSYGSMAAEDEEALLLLSYTVRLSTSILLIIVHPARFVARRRKRIAVAYILSFLFPNPIAG